MGLNALLRLKEQLLVLRKTGGVAVDSMPAAAVLLRVMRLLLSSSAAASGPRCCLRLFLSTSTLRSCFRSFSPLPHSSLHCLSRIST